MTYGIGRLPIFPLHPLVSRCLALAFAAFVCFSHFPLAFLFGKIGADLRTFKAAGNAS